MRKLTKAFIGIVLTFTVAFTNTFNNFDELQAIEKNSTKINDTTKGIGNTIAQTFPDPVFAQAIADELGVNIDTVITQNMVDTTFFINVKDVNVTDITGISVFSNLREFGVIRTTLSTVPDEIGSLTKLTGLWLLDSQITALPESIGNLTELTRLHIQRNQITSLPSSLSKLTKLTWVTAERNLLPTDAHITLNSLGLDYVFEIETQKKLKLNTGTHIYKIENQEDIDNIDLRSLVNVLNTSILSPSHNLILSNYTNEDLQQVNIEDYIKNGNVIKSGSVFANIRSTGEGLFPNNSDNAQTDRSIRLDFEMPKYNLTFDENGAVVTVPPIQNLSEGETGEVVENPTREGYTFDGWNTKADGTGTNWIPGTTPMVANDTTLYAQWKKAIYNINYNLDGGTNALENQTTYEHTIGVNEFAPAQKEGYTFLGWYDSLVDGNRINSISETSIGDITLHARWKATTYNIIYVLDGGINATSNPTSYQQNLGVSDFAPAQKEGYTFLGWYDSANGGSVVNNLAVNSTGDKTLYARWSKNTTVTNILPQTGNSINLYGLSILSVTSLLYLLFKHSK